MCRSTACQKHRKHCGNSNVYDYMVILEFYNSCRTCGTTVKISTANGPPAQYKTFRGSESRGCELPTGRLNLSTNWKVSFLPPEPNPQISSHVRSLTSW